MDKPVLGVEEIIGKTVLDDKVLLLGHELGDLERDKQNDNTSVSF